MVSTEIVVWMSGLVGLFMIMGTAIGPAVTTYRAALQAEYNETQDLVNELQGLCVQP